MRRRRRSVLGGRRPGEQVLSLALDFAHALESQETLHLVFQFLRHVSIVRVLLQSMVFSVEEAFDVVVVVLGGALPVELGVVVEEIGVDLVEHPGPFKERLLHEHEGRGGDPVDEGARGPLVRERQVEELQYLEEGAEAIDEPMFIVLGNASAEVDVIEDGGDDGQDQVGVGFVQVGEPPNASTGQGVVLVGDLPDAEDHDDEDGDLDDVVEVERS